MAQISIQKEAEPKKPATEQKAERAESKEIDTPRRPFDIMRRMLRWDPFEAMTPWSFFKEAQGMSPDFEIKETKDAFVFKADVPGIEAKDAAVNLIRNRLTISGKREEEKKNEGDTYYTYERSYGSFSRSFTLPEATDPDKISAEMKDGVLTITVPKTAEAKSKRIEVTPKA